VSTINVKTLMTGPREVTELEIRERPPLMLRNALTAGSQEGASACISGSSHHRPSSRIHEVPELEIWERSAYGARPSDKAVNGCRNLGTNAQRVVRTHFTLTQVGHFC
jgi:hypothetical protein